jgi:hypothetical protein
MPDNPKAVAAELRTPRAAAVAGIIFALLLGTVLVLMHSALPGAHPSGWITDESNRRTLSLALDLMPFAGIAFLWFIGVIRSRLGDREDKLFATVFLGSGLLFVAMLFTATAITGGVLRLFDSGAQVSNETLLLADGISNVLVGTLAVRMAAVFALVVTNLGRRTQLIPTWLMVIGYAVGLVLLLIPSHVLLVAMFFPLWVLVFSLHILVVSFRSPDAAATGGSPSLG